MTYVSRSGRARGVGLRDAYEPPKKQRTVHAATPAVPLMEHTVGVPYHFARSAVHRELEKSYGLNACAFGNTALRRFPQP
jgi:hypothetical protein